MKIRGKKNKAKLEILRSDAFSRSEKIKNYQIISQYLALYENAVFLKDVHPACKADAPYEVDDVQMFKKMGMNAIKGLVKCYIPDYLVEEAFVFVISKYEADWNKYLIDAPFLKSKLEYVHYSWRSTGPKPYFEAIFDSFLKLANKKHRSIDDV